MATRRTIEVEIDRFVDEQRARCLWFVRSDWYPRTDEERARILEQIQRHADRATFVRAAELRRWLSPSGNDASAAS